MTTPTFPPISGSLVALVTPMQADGTVDFTSLKRLVDWHVAEGTAAIVSMGTTGESATLDFDEHLKVIETTLQAAAGRIPVIAGTGGNSTTEAIYLTEQARVRGAVAGLSVVPYYNKPTQEGLYQHFRKIAETVELPLILYNVPGRTVADLSNATALRLAQIPGIVGIKDATGLMGRVAELAQRAPKNFVLYSGDDDSALAYLLLGGHGVISVTANVAPRRMAELCAAARAGDLARARAANDALQGLHRALFVESSPAPAKWALGQMGQISPGIRLPLVPLSPAGIPAMREAMQQAGITT